MTEFEREWAYAERERHARLLYQLKREIIAKRQAAEMQARLQQMTQSHPGTISAAVPAATTPTAPARPSQKPPTSPSKPLSSGR